MRRQWRVPVCDWHASPIGGHRRARWRLGRTGDASGVTRRVGLERYLLLLLVTMLSLGVQGIAHPGAVQRVCVTALAGGEPPAGVRRRARLASHHASGHVAVAALALP